MTHERFRRLMLELLIIFAPLGTIWIFTHGVLNGVAWPMGNVGVYASELFALAYLLLSWKMIWTHPASRWLVGLSVALLVLSALRQFNLLSLIFTLRIILAAFLTLAVSRETFELRRIWTLSLVIPAIVALIALVDSRTQADSLLGIASHEASTPGTAVIEYLRRGAVVREWRSYGTFPHPNIFGGFLAVWFMVTALTRSRAPRLVLALAGFLLASTFSRDAILSVLVFSAVFFFQKPRVEDLAYFWGGLTLGLASWFPAFTARTGITSSRLETASLSGRVAGIHNGLNLFFNHPWFGVGLMQSAPALAIFLNSSQPFWDFEIPHLVPLLLLAEVGLLGTALIGALFAVVIKPLWRKELIPLCLGLTVLALFDHFSVTSAQFLLIEALALGTVAACGNNQK